MERLERLFKIDRLIRDRQAVPMSVLRERLEVSHATVKRDIECFRDRFGAPIVWDRKRRGYRYHLSPGEVFELPGLWFSAREALALLTMQHLLSDLEPGLLGSHVEALKARLAKIIDTGPHSAAEIHRRVKLVHLAARRRDHRFFAIIGQALLERRRLRISHYSRLRDQTTVREVSPQRLVHYRENWYLDAWCHVAGDLRSFAVDAVREAAIVGTRARDVAAGELDQRLKAGYGIFGGSSVQWARLRFTAQRARWVADERWHADQRQRFDADGSFVLEIPYADDRELVGDILRHGPDCLVEAPAALRDRVAELAHETAQQYRAGGPSVDVGG